MTRATTPLDSVPTALLCTCMPCKRNLNLNFILILILKKKKKTMKKINPRFLFFWGAMLLPNDDVTHARTYVHTLFVCVCMCLKKRTVVYV